MRWREAPHGYGPHKTIYNRFVRRSRLGVFNKIFTELARKAGKPRRLLIDTNHLKAHRPAVSLLKKGVVPRRIGRTKGGLNSKLHALCYGQGRPLIMLLGEGQMSEYKGAALMLNDLPRVKELLGDRGYDADWFRQALAERCITACIPSKSNGKAPIEHDRIRHRQRHIIENMFRRLKGWRLIHTCYDRCAHTFISAICIRRRCHLLPVINDSRPQPVLPNCPTRNVIYHDRTNHSYALSQ